MASLDDFSTALAVKLNVPDSTQFHRFIALWVAAETDLSGKQGGAQNNPLNTTQGASGATNFNSIGVKNYPDFQAGVDATATTLQDSYFYPNLIPFFRALGDPVTFSQFYWFPLIAQDIGTWGTGKVGKAGTFADEINAEGKGLTGSAIGGQIRGENTLGAVTNVDLPWLFSNAVGAASDVVGSVPGAVGTVVGSVANAVTDPLAAIGKAMSWLTDGHHWMRLLFITGGIILIVSGIFIYASSTSLGQTAIQTAGKAV